jgi:methionyl-tRNA formyltransferase
MVKNIKVNTIFIGSSIYTLSAMYNLSNVISVFIENNTQKKEVVEFCNKKKIKFYYVQSSSDILDILTKASLYPDICFVTNASIILKQDLIDHCKAVFNFHNGDLSTNRGANPIYHSILNRDDFMYLVCHTIESEQIDKGNIICEIKVPINYDLDFKSNVKIIHHFSDALVKHVIFCYITYGYVRGVPAIVKKNSYKKRIDVDTKENIKKVVSLKYGP